MASELHVTCFWDDVPEQDRDSDDAAGVEQTSRICDLDARARRRVLRGAHGWTETGGRQDVLAALRRLADELAGDEAPEHILKIFVHRRS